MGGIDIKRTIFGKVVGLPTTNEGTFFVVSRLVMAACPSREDLVAPNDLVRDEQGRIIGCRSFSR